MPVFDSATTFPIISLIKKTATQDEINYLEVKSLDFPDLKSLVLSTSKKLPKSAINVDSWRIFENLKGDVMLEKLRNGSQKLVDYTEGKILRGIVTGLNEAFIINEAKRNELILKNARSMEIITPLLNGDDVRKYRTDYKKNYLIVTKLGIEIEQYPAVFDHLKQYQAHLEKRLDQGNHWWELRSCAYYDSFETPKILYPDIALESRFTLDYENFYLNTTLFCIPKEDKYLLALLNSKARWFYLSKVCPVLGDSNKRGRLRLKTVYLKKLPVKLTNN